MKKKLEADLISIAHRILKLKNKSDINQLYLETQKLYEKLAILKFVDENFDTLKPTIGHSEITSEIESIFDKDFDKEEIIAEEVKIEEPVAVAETPVETIAEPETVEEIKTEEIPAEEATEEVAEEISTEEVVAEIPEEVIPEPIIETIPEPVAETIEEPIAEKTEEPIAGTNEKTNIAEELSFTTISDLKPIPDFVPLFQLEEEEVKEKEEPIVEIPAKNSPITISFEDFGVNYADAQFVKVDSYENVTPTPTPVISELKEKKETIETVVIEKPAETKAATLNEKLAKGFHVDLNDRIAFTKNLFGNSSEDYSRVLNQLLTFDSYGEAQEFIENMVKPDYNNWEGKDDYAERFLGIVEKKFS
ncbi:hypothetical protein B0A67_22765 [Flavobacterium aquidurense]|jgi:hypothetical protein|uniref:hypothetical protein n=1 Tax=Flavobacterium aquidurense TaxID=362413 RepID=UPI00091914A3|nr:hypothetical protein [Flavobacterium aquidurense]OXA67066.1 hypothetical protein B0A67_22765 [Flavobacterium aquidurense]SHH87528.1 hypothetical protein SAMN05444481_13718 [Flavobacterium frigidimaris]